MKKQDLTIPNLLSVLRIVIIPFIVICYLKERYFMAAVMLLASGLTDMLDGVIARHFNQISELGKLLDPLADKLTMAMVVFTLALNHYQIRLMLAVLVFKELLMLIGALLLFGRGTRPSESKIFGKLATGALYAVLFVVMVCDIIGKLSGGAFVLPSLAIWIMSILCCVLMVLALMQYSYIFMAIKTGKYDIKTEKFEGEK